MKYYKGPHQGGRQIWQIFRSEDGKTFEVWGSPIMLFDNPKYRWIDAGNLSSPNFEYYGLYELTEEEAFLEML